jgi:SHS2 domain-containing protein
MSLKPFKYNFPDITRGDTYKGATLTVKNITTSTEIDLTGVSIKMKLQKCGQSKAPYSLELSTANGLITITDPVNGVFNINQFNMDIEASKYDYDLQFTFVGGVVQTYMFGTWNVVNDITK